MSRIISCFLFSIISCSLIAQYNSWVWMHGPNTSLNQFFAPQAGAIYGTMGIEDANNQPPAWFADAYWRGDNNDFWIYTGRKDEMWRYNTLTNSWTWIKGDNSPSPGYILPTYGTKGIADPANSPGSQNTPTFWRDVAGNFYMYGGSVNTKGRINTVWKYSSVSNEWIWIAGDKDSLQPAINGTKGVWSVNNNPGAMDGAEVFLSTQNSDTVYMYGGRYQDYTGKSGFMRDLWAFNNQTQEWVWLNGNLIANDSGNYTTLGQYSSGNYPGCRAWIGSGIKQENSLMFFGGWTSLYGGANHHDLWDFDLSINQWGWLGGTDETFRSSDLAKLNNYKNLYEDFCIANDSNLPYSRSLAYKWIDDCGNLWIYGGRPLEIVSNYLLDDFWMYSRKNNSWLRISGSDTLNQDPIYGTKGIPDIANTPGARGGGGGNFRFPNDNTLWLFGGQAKLNPTNGYYYNDVWKFVPDKPTASFSYIITDSILSICEDTLQAVYFTNNSSPGCNEIKNFEWDFGDPSSGLFNLSDSANPFHLYSQSGTYQVQLIVTNCTGSKDTSTQTIDVTIRLEADTGLCDIKDTIFIPNAMRYTKEYWDYFIQKIKTKSTNSSFILFNRKGAVIYNSEINSEIDLKQLPDVFIYHFSFMDSSEILHSLKGNIFLIK